MTFSDNLKTKKELRFKNGKFKIVIFSDLHGKITFDRRTVKCVERFVEKHNPDMVLLCGDNVCGDWHLQSEQLFKNSFNDIANIFESRRIPWAHVYGNHDNEVGLWEVDQQPIYESYEHCVSKRGPENLHRVSNYMLPIKASEGDEIKFNIWALDALQPGQVIWYHDTSVELEKYCGKKIPSIMYLHVPTPEFRTISMNAKAMGMVGENRENVCDTGFNYGLVAFAANRGDVKGIYCGHDHVNTFSAYYRGIHLGYCGGLSFNVYMHPDLRCCRVIEIDENDPAAYNTFLDMVLEDEVLKEIPGMDDYNLEVSIT